jgi:hypothetical protein
MHFAYGLRVRERNDNRDEMYESLCSRLRLRCTFIFIADINFLFKFIEKGK